MIVAQHLMCLRSTQDHRVLKALLIVLDFRIMSQIVNNYINCNQDTRPEECGQSLTGRLCCFIGGMIFLLLLFVLNTHPI